MKFSKRLSRDKAAMYVIHSVDSERQITIPANAKRKKLSDQFVTLLSELRVYLETHVLKIKHFWHPEQLTRLFSKM